MERAITDENFLVSNINLIKGLRFPALKGTLVNYVINATNDPNILSRAVAVLLVAKSRKEN